MQDLNGVRINVMVTDMDRALDFYTNALDLTLANRYGNHYAEVDANGFIIGIHPGGDAANYGTNMSIGLGVRNFDQNVEALEAKGIVFRITNDGYIRLAHFSDPDGNLLYLAENPNA